MRMGLVRYIGGKTAPFSLERGGGPARYWTKAQGYEHAQARRWLPESEANSYAQLRNDFEIVRWGGNTPQGQLSPPRRRRRAPTLEPKQAAIPVSVLLEEREKVEREMKEMEKILLEVEEEAEFYMSSSGTVHRADCSFASRIKKPVKFFTLEDAASDPSFTKYHSCVVA